MAIATLIAAGALDDRLVAEAADRLGGGTAKWLDAGDAAAVVTSFSVDDARDALRDLGGADVIVVPDDFRPALFVADMDSTMIGQESIDELAAEAGVGERVAAITERAMRGELDFAAALQERLALLEGLPVSTIDHLLDTRIRPNPGAAALIATLKARGVRTMLVSGGFTAFADVVSRGLGFDRVVANRLGVASGRLTGAVDGALIDSAAKLALLQAESAAIGGHSIAIGDGANDMPMIAAADLGIAYRAKPKVAAAADARIDIGGLDALLWGLGIAKADWVVR
ncbi:MAG: phosphoserine phosphatase SerB [Sphingomicrobium sp.]